MERDWRNDSGLPPQLSEEDYIEVRQTKLSCYPPERPMLNHQLPQQQFQESLFLDGGVSAELNNAPTFGAFAFPHLEKQGGQLQVKDGANQRGNWQALDTHAQVLATTGSNCAVYDIVQLPNPHTRVASEHMNHGASGESIHQASLFLDHFGSFDCYDTTCSGIKPDMRPTMKENSEVNWRESVPSATAGFHDFNHRRESYMTVAANGFDHTNRGVGSDLGRQTFMSNFPPFLDSEAPQVGLTPAFGILQQKHKYYPNQQHKQPAAGAQAFTVVTDPTKQNFRRDLDSAKCVSDVGGCPDVGEMNRQSRGRGLESMYSFFSDGSSESQLSGGNETFLPSGGNGAVQRQLSFAFQDNSKTDWPDAGNVAAGFNTLDDGCVPYAADTTSGFAHPNHDENFGEFGCETSASSVSLFLDSPPCYNQTSEIQLTTPQRFTMQQFYPGQLRQPAAGAHTFTAITEPMKQMADQYGKASLETVVQGVNGGAPYRPPLESIYSFYSDADSESQHGSKEASLPSPSPGVREDQHQATLSGRESEFSFFQDAPGADVGVVQDWSIPRERYFFSDADRGYYSCDPREVFGEFGQGEPELNGHVAGGTETLSLSSSGGGRGLNSITMNERDGQGQIQQSESENPTTIAAKDTALGDLFALISRMQPERLSAGAEVLNPAPQRNDAVGVLGGNVGTLAPSKFQDEPFVKSRGVAGSADIASPTNHLVSAKTARRGGIGRGILNPGLYADSGEVIAFIPLTPPAVAAASANTTLMTSASMNSKLTGTLPVEDWDPVKPGRSEQVAELLGAAAEPDSPPGWDVPANAPWNQQNLELSGPQVAFSRSSANARPYSNPQSSTKESNKLRFRWAEALKGEDGERLFREPKYLFPYEPNEAQLALLASRQKEANAKAEAKVAGTKRKPRPIKVAVSPGLRAKVADIMLHCPPNGLPLVDFNIAYSKAYKFNIAVECSKHGFTFDDLFQLLEGDVLEASGYDVGLSAMIYKVSTKLFEFKNNYGYQNRINEIDQDKRTTADYYHDADEVTDDTPAEQPSASRDPVAIGRTAQDELARLLQSHQPGDSMDHLAVAEAIRKSQENPKKVSKEEQWELENFSNNMGFLFENYYRKPRLAVDEMLPTYNTVCADTDDELTFVEFVFKLTRFPQLIAFEFDDGTLMAKLVVPILS